MIVTIAIDSPALAGPAGVPAEDSGDTAIAPHIAEYISVPYTTLEAIDAVKAGFTL